MVMKPELRRNERGQATIEYILMLAVLVSFFVAFQKMMKDIGVAKLLMKPLQSTYASTYRYGHPKAKGLDDGGPSNHPRIRGGESGFRLFINPRAQ